MTKEELEKENRLLGERCNQLLKDKGNLTDELSKWKDEWQEQVQKAIDEGWERTKLTGRVRELENQIDDIKANCDLAIEGRDIKISELEEENKKLDRALITSTKNNIERQKIIDSLQKEKMQIIANCSDKEEGLRRKIFKLEQQIEKMKMCCNCRKWRECGEQLDYISYPCHQHDCDDVCPIWELWERR